MSSIAKRTGPQAIVVTGGSRGIGQAYVERMHALGHDIVVVARSSPPAFAAGPGRVLALEADVTQPGTAQAALDFCLQRFGRVDVLVNNAGGGGRRQAEATPGSTAAWEYFDDTLRFNLLSTIMFCDVFAPAMVKSGAGGRILNVSSSGGRSYARVSDASYCASKAGVLGLTRQLAYQLGPHGILVNAIAPGTTLASPRVRDRIEQLPEADRQRILDGIPLRRFADNDDMVGPMEFLTVGASDYMTGVVLDVNGGFYMA